MRGALVATEIVDRGAHGAGRSEAWAPLSSTPRINRWGILGLALSRIENKLDLRALIDLATVSAALIAGVLWFFAIGRDVLLQVTSCGNIEAVASKTNVILSLALVFVLAVLVVRRLLIRRKRRKADWHSEYKILQRVMVAHVKSPQMTDYYYRWVLRARKDGLESFSMPFQWTGTRKKFQAHLRNPAYTCKFPTNSDWKNGEFLVNFNKTLRRGDEEVIEFYFETETEQGGEPSPVISTGIASNKYPKFNTILKVLFDPGVGVAAVYRRRYFIGIDGNPIKAKVVTMTSDRSHSWRVPIRIGWRFAIRWEYA
jgi:hypothetical protein